MRLFYLVVILFLFNSSRVSCQERITTAGFQFKPIFSSSFFSTGPQKFDNNDSVQFVYKQNTGFCAGMVIRKGITKNFSFETGINYVNRSFTLESSDNGITDKNKFRIVSYEVPTMALLFIRLSEYIFMDVAFGHSLDIFPSDVYSKTGYFAQYGARRNWIASSLLANLGYEYRTKKSGYIYLGVSYHRPFKFIYVSEIEYKHNGEVKNIDEKLNGNYLTVDIRYFFHADPEKRKNRIKKSK